MARKWSERCLQVASLALALMTCCAGFAYASGSEPFDGEWAYAKKCEAGHYLSLHLKQRGDRVTGDWSEGTNARGSSGRLRGVVRGDTLLVRYCSDDGEVGYSACPAFSPPDDQFLLEKGRLIRYQQYGADYRRGVALSPRIAGKEVPYDQQCEDTGDGQQ